MEERINKIEQNLGDLIEIVGYIKDNMATKADIAEVRVEMATGISKSEDSLKSYINDRLAKSEHNMKSYIDDKLADQTAEIGAKIDRATGRQRDFNSVLVDGLESNSLFEAERINKLKTLNV